MNLLQSFEPLILGFHFVICIFLIVVILLQAGKGADMGATFGAGGSQSLFGARGAATFLSKITTVAAACFLVTSLSLATIHRHAQGTSDMNKSVLDALPVPQQQEKKTDQAQPAPAENNKDSQTK
jgi:preprotein translocase subunit SecG